MVYAWLTHQLGEPVGLNAHASEAASTLDNGSTAAWTPCTRLHMLQSPDALSLLVACFSPRLCAVSVRSRLAAHNCGSACRLLDLHAQQALDLSPVLCVALDECDKLLSQGFSAQLQQLHAILFGDADAAASGQADPPPATSSAQQVGSPAAERRPDCEPAHTQCTALRHRVGVTSARPQIILVSATMGAALPEALASWPASDAHRVVVDGTAGAAAMSSTVTQARNRSAILRCRGSCTSALLLRLHASQGASDCCCFRLSDHDQLPRLLRALPLQLTGRQVHH